MRQIRMKKDWYSKMIKHLITASLSLIAIALHSQTLEIKLPYHAGREYYFCLQQGASQDTVATGKLDLKGKATITLKQGYRGVGRLTLQGYGKIRNVILNDEECILLSEADSLETETIFYGSPENTFLIEAIARQKRIIYSFNKGSASVYSSLPSPKQEYQAFRKEMADSPLYAARVFEILNLLTGVGSSFDISQQEILEEQHSFIVNKLDFDDLYTSGFWQLVFELWYQLASFKEQQADSLLVTDSKAMLNRCGAIPIRREVTQVIIRLFSKYGKDQLLAELGTEYLTMPLNGQPAPAIKMGETFFLPKSSLIVFYETGCGNCHYELENLKGKYPLLSNEHNSIRVVSISADVDRYVFEETAEGLPWADKLCDFNGFDGDNFKNYGIVGTPTFILTDKEGIVRGRYASLRELIK